MERMITTKEKPKKYFQIKTTGTTLTNKIIEIIGIKTGNAGPTTLWL
jgi:hypothetical protein